MKLWFFQENKSNILPYDRYTEYAFPKTLDAPTKKRT